MKHECCCLIFDLCFILMLILGIETSCDEIAAAVVKDGREVLVSEVASSLSLHQETLGIVPEIAARDAALKIIPVIETVLTKAELEIEQVDAIAVTSGPGLAGSLLVGLEAARVLAFVHDKPLVGVHHIIGHLFANLLEREQEPKFPSLVLTVSGGHNDLIYWRDWLSFELVGETLDDAAGEAFDKVAKMLGLGFPGGPIISKLAAKGDSKAFDFPRPMASKSGFDFSFSGLKTAVLYKWQELEQVTQDREKLIADIAASFQEAVIDSLVRKFAKAALKYQPRELYLAGGVAANNLLRIKAEELANKLQIPLWYPKKISFCTDNAEMIASAGYYLFTKLPSKSWDFRAVELSLDFNLPQFH
jgi:N6-L-threonylcarbamoyladenine synthase